MKWALLAFAWVGAAATAATPEGDFADDKNQSLYRVRRAGKDLVVELRSNFGCKSCTGGRITTTFELRERGELWVAVNPKGSAMELAGLETGLRTSDDWRSAEWIVGKALGTRDESVTVKTPLTRLSQSASKDLTGALVRQADDNALTGEARLTLKTLAAPLTGPPPNVSPEAIRKILGLSGCPAAEPPDASWAAGCKFAYRAQVSRMKPRPVLRLEARGIVPETAHLRCSFINELPGSEVECAALR